MPQTLPTISKKEQDIFSCDLKTFEGSHVKFGGARLYVSHEKKEKLRHVAQQLRFATNELCSLSLSALTVCIMLTVVFNCKFNNTFIDVTY